MYIEADLTYFGLYDYLAPLFVAEGWTVHRQTADEMIVESPNGGVTSMCLDYYAVTESYNIFFNCSLEYDSAQDFYNQPESISMGNNGFASSTRYSYLNQLCLSENFRAFISIDDRRFILAARTGIYYQLAMSGLMLPYASPTSYPMPLFCSASRNYDYRASSGNTTYTANARFDNTSNRLLDGWHVYQTDAKWVKGLLTPQINDADGLWRQDLSGQVSLYPVQVISGDMGDGNYNGAWLGMLGGLYRICGHGVTAEDIITIGVDEYICIPDHQRTQPHNFYAIKKA